MLSAHSIFVDQGGFFCSSKQVLEAKVWAIKAFVFDWDGVFNEGFQHEQGSLFSEIDAMGINMLRFSRYLTTGSILPIAIISGGKNAYSQQLGKREHYNEIYYKALDKNHALTHFMSIHSLAAHEIAFVFDDILDMALAQQCGTRILVDHGASPLLKRYVITHSLADYITSHTGGGHAIRETCELLMGLQKNYDDTIEHRIAFSDTYRRYLNARNDINTVLYAMNDSQAILLSQID